MFGERLELCNRTRYVPHKHVRIHRLRECIDQNDIPVATSEQLSQQTFAAPQRGFGWRIIIDGILDEDEIAVIRQDIALAGLKGNIGFSVAMHDAVLQKDRIPSQDGYGARSGSWFESRIVAR